LRNLDRILEGNARSWWQSHILNNVDNFVPAAAVPVWRNVRGALVDFFGDEAAKEIAKDKNKRLKFRVGEDPQNFVAKKMELIRTIHPEISESRIVEKLLKDLPEDIAINMTVSCGAGATVQRFLFHLRRIVEVEERRRRKVPQV
jgi:hypothetical protein